MNCRLVGAPVLATAFLVLAACAGCTGGSAQTSAATGNGSNGADGGDGRDGADAGVQVLASFYPLQFVAERVGGDRAAVTNLTPPGAEAHDLELAPSDVAAVGEADLVLHLGGFQPAVDDAVETTGAGNSMDVAEAADLSLAGGEGAHAEEHAEEEHAEEEHAEEAAGAEAPDPHFWLDPLRLAAVGDAVAARLAQVDPEGAAAYEQGAAQLRQDLQALDAEVEQGLSSCTDRTLVTSHEAFAYLADRYDLEQVGISGLSAEDEPTAAQMAEVTDFVRVHGVSTIYVETLVAPELAETVAAETGASTAVLDPLEGLTEDAAGEDYLAVMRANLEVLRAGQSCA
ncbi:zinc transport system substrate-binding protein [Quadrisphaera sp. DSM 44207]|nr:metal ABC transporter substrate-binding protein [Quadrisphaera sp. DSM 44207]SDQ04612.1 zinc transport system substrate-binding protein [Quadrisphaera sp. DSM 44207]